jgi:O-antigen/teichoic acid export membrane protein
MFAKGIVVSRGLGVEFYGIFNLISAFSNLIHQFLKFTLSSVLIKFGAEFLGLEDKSKFKSLIKGILSLSLFLGFISNLFIILTTWLLYDVFFDKPNLQVYIILFGIVTSTAFVDGLSAGALQLFYKFKARSIIDIIVVLLELLLVSLVLYFYPENFKRFFVAVLVSRLLGSLFLNLRTWQLIGPQIKGFWKTKLSNIKDEKKEIVNFTFANSGSRILKNLSNNGDVLLLGALSGPSAVAFYNIAKKLAQSILILVDPIAKTLFPQLSHLISQKKYGEIQLMIGKVTKLLFLPCLLFMGALYYFRADLIELAYGAEFLPATQPFVYLAANAILAALLFWNLPMLLSMGLVNFRLKVEAVFLIIGASIAYFTIPTMGASGVALGLLVTGGGAKILFAAITFAQARKEAAHAA